MADARVPNGDVSWWWRQLGGTPSPRPPLDRDLDVDVAIVGGGYTGLWAAYYLTTLQPDLRVAVLEQRFAGFGASGRNGGWLTNTVTGGRDRYAASHGRDAAIAQQRALNETVDEVIANAHLATYTVTGPNLQDLANDLKNLDGVDMVAPFGAALHVSGRDAWKLDVATREMREDGSHVWRSDEPTLEDVFIDLMSRAQDNFA